MIHPFIGWVIPTQWFRGLNQGKPKWIHLIWVKKLEKWWKKTCFVIVSTCSYLAGIYIPPTKKLTNQNWVLQNNWAPPKKNTSYFPLHWLFDREAYDDVWSIPGRISSPTLNNQDFFHFSTDQNLRRFLPWRTWVLHRPLRWPSVCSKLWKFNRKGWEQRSWHWKPLKT